MGISSFPTTIDSKTNYSDFGPPNVLHSVPRAAFQLGLLLRQRLKGEAWHRCNILRRVHFYILFNIIIF